MPSLTERWRGDRARHASLVVAILAGACGDERASIGIVVEQGNAVPSAAQRGPCGSGEPTEPPRDLACTGLFAGELGGEVAGSVRAYEPAARFWSDGADKGRWIFLPPGSTID